MVKHWTNLPNLKKVLLSSLDQNVNVNCSDTDTMAELTTTDQIAKRKKRKKIAINLAPDKADHLSEYVGAFSKVKSCLLNSI